MRTIWKLPLQVTDIQRIKIPKNSGCLTIQVQYGVPCIWIACEDKEELEECTLYTHGTGHEISPKATKYLGSYQLDGGALVFHVFVEL